MRGLAICTSSSCLPNDWFSFCTVSSWFCVVVICCCVVVNCCCVVASCCCAVVSCSFSELISSLASSSCCLSLSLSCVCRLANIARACMLAVCMSASFFFFRTAAFWVVLFESVFCSLSVLLCLVVGFEVCASDCFCFFLVWAHLPLHLMMHDWFLPVL